MTLFHFTCQHGYEGIEEAQSIRPNPHPWMKALGPVIWLTDLEQPDAFEVGLTSQTLSCDRLKHRYEVTTQNTHKWTDLRYKVHSTLVEELESLGKPEHWFLVRRPLTKSEFSYSSR